MSTKTILSSAMLLLSLFMLGGCETARYIPSDSSYTQTAQPGVPAKLILKDNKVNSMIGPAFGGKSTHSQLKGQVSSSVPQWGLPQPGSPELLTTVEVKRNAKESKTGWGSFFLYLVTLTLIPANQTEAFDIHVQLSTVDGQTIYDHTVTEKVKSYLSVYFPTPLFLGSMGGSAYNKMLDVGLSRQQYQLELWVDEQQASMMKATEGKDIYAKRQWLLDNPQTLFRQQLVKELAQNPPEGKALDWHRENLTSFAGYRQHLNKEDLLWFVGPEGQRVVDIVDALKNGEDQTILAARIEAGGPYKLFDSQETARLKELGLSSELIAAMIRSSQGSTPAPVPSMQRTVAAAAPAGSYLDSLLIANNSGAYMNPWTSDGVLADWMDKAINAKIGSATGSAVGAAAGAYAANKVLENIPFGGMFGGMIGSKVGKEAGRNAAIKASGGMEYIRQSSDQSFRSLTDMARYLKATYSASTHFTQAIKAADAIYPGLLKAVSSAP